MDKLENQASEVTSLIYKVSKVLFYLVFPEVLAVTIIYKMEKTLPEPDLRLYPTLNGLRLFSLMVVYLASYALALYVVTLVHVQIIMPGADPRSMAYAFVAGIHFSTAFCIYYSLAFFK